jgi:hypothetical protein
LQSFCKHSVTNFPHRFLRKPNPQLNQIAP